MRCLVLERGEMSAGAREGKGRAGQGRAGRGPDQHQRGETAGEGKDAGKTLTLALAGLGWAGLEGQGGRRTTSRDGTRVAEDTMSLAYCCCCYTPATSCTSYRTRRTHSEGRRRACRLVRSPKKGLHHGPPRWRPDSDSVYTRAAHTKLLFSRRFHLHEMELDLLDRSHRCAEMPDNVGLSEESLAVMIQAKYRHSPSCITQKRLDAQIRRLCILYVDSSF